MGILTGPTTASLPLHERVCSTRVPCPETQRGLVTRLSVSTTSKWYRYLTAMGSIPHAHSPPSHPSAREPRWVTTLPCYCWATIQTKLFSNFTVFPVIIVYFRLV
jgi:hypothetical protein